MFYPETYNENLTTAHGRILEACKTLAQRDNLPTEELERASKETVFDARSVADTLEALVGDHRRIIEACKALAQMRGLSTKEFEQASLNPAMSELCELEAAADVLEILVTGHRVNKTIPVGIV